MVNAALSKAGRPDAGKDRGRSPSQAPQRSKTSSQDSKGTSRPHAHIPNPIIAGCRCCEDQGHGRQTCRNIQAFKDASHGKVPKDYHGASEKSMKKAAKSPVGIKAMTSRPAETTQRGQDLTSANISGRELVVETYLWPMVSAPAPPRNLRSPPTVIRNRYDDRTDSDVEESEVVKALVLLTYHVH